MKKYTGCFKNVFKFIKQKIKGCRKKGHSNIFTTHLILVNKLKIGALKLNVYRIYNRAADFRYKNIVELTNTFKSNESEIFVNINTFNNP